MNRDIAPFGLRMPESLKSWWLQQAKNNNRSLNAEIVTQLQLLKSKLEKEERRFSVNTFADNYAGIARAGTVTVKLTVEQAALILGTHDNGIRNLSTAEVEQLDQIVSLLKNEIWH